MSLKIQKSEKQKSKNEAQHRNRFAKTVIDAAGGYDDPQ